MSGVEPGQRGSVVVATIEFEAQRRGISLTQASVQIFGSKSRLHNMRIFDGSTRKRTIEQVQAWLESAPATPPAGGSSRSSVGSDGGSGKAAGANVAAFPPYPTGAQLADELRAAAKAAGVRINDFLAPLVAQPHTYLETLARGARPMPETVARARALIAGEPLPPRAPQARRSGDTRPSGSKSETEQARETIAQQERRRLERLAIADQARETRRAGQALADRIREIGREVDAEAADETAARRERELIELPTPSSLIKRLERDWPQLNARVAAHAAEEGLQRAEAWSRVIDAGLEQLCRGG